MQLHPACEPLAFLLGTWRGSGRGDYPTIAGFEYVEEVTFGHVGKPFLSYSQKTRDAATDLPLHAEVGYLRPVDDRSVELLLVQPSGIGEMHIGTVEDASIDLRSAQVVLTPSAKPVTQVERHLVVRGDELSYTVAMAAVGEPLTHHLEATLLRQD